MRERIGHYAIVSQLGRGGMGVVYKAREESLNRYVAIKLLGEHLKDDEGLVRRFVREAQAAAGLSHPNIVQIYYIGEDGGEPYFVMEYVEGRSLAQIVAAEVLVRNPRAAQIMVQAAHGLAAAHDKGIIHRDIKPDNLMLDDNGIVKIADFGLALPVDATTRLTGTGKLIGTAGYFAPEQCRGEQADHRTDIYALGVTYYEMLTGMLPFRAESPIALIRQIVDEDPPDIEKLNPEVDADSRRILLKMIEKDRADRYQSCHDIAADLEEYLSSRGVRSATAGLAKRSQSRPPGPATREAQSAPTVVIGATGADPAIADTMPSTIVPAQPVAAVTAPEIPFVPSDTRVSGGRVPAAVATANAAAPPPAPATPRRSPLLAIAAILLVALGLAAGGAVLAYRMFRGGVADRVAKEATPAAAPKNAGSPADRQPVRGAVAASAPDVLLANRIEPPAGPPAGSAGSSPEARSQPLAPSSAQPSAAEVSRDRLAAAPRAPKILGSRAGMASAGESRGEPSDPPARTLSGVAVVVAGEGDPVLASAVSDLVEAEVSSAGLRIADSSSQGGDTRRLLDRARGENAAVLLVVRIDPAGQRDLQYMGRREVAFSSRVSVALFDVATGRPIGPRSTGVIDYTARTADREADKVVGRMLRKGLEGVGR